MSFLDSDLPVRSSDGMAALDIFYTDFNDINFYVEDEDQENLYEVILKKQFPDVTISRIFPLGGKKAVLAHADSDSNTTISTFRAYLLDKDFDDYLGIQRNQSNIFYLDKFCIENYLTDPDAAVEIVIENHPKKKRSEIRETLNLPEIVGRTYNGLKPLFSLFYCVQYLDLGIKNCNTSPEAYCNSKTLWQLNDQVFAAYIASVCAAAAQKQVHPPLDDPLKDLRVIKILNDSDHKVVSGKFAGAMLFHYIKSKFSLGSMTFESFMYRLAKNSNMNDFDVVARSITNEYNEYKEKGGQISAMAA